MSGTLSPPAAFGIPSRFTIIPTANTQSGGRSPFNGSEQTLEMPGWRWAASLSWEGLDQSEWRPLLAFIVQLGGTAGRFDWSPSPVIPRRGTAQSAAGNTARVQNAGQTGRSLVTLGWDSNGFVGRAGDLVGWTAGGRPQMHMLTADVGAAATPTTLVTLPISPPLRISPAANAALVLTAPPARWRLSADRTPMDIMRGLMAGGSLDIEEALV